MKLKMKKIMRVKGFSFSGVSAGIKAGRKKDLALIASENPATVAGVFTSNKIKAAPVLLDIRRVAGGSASAIVVNSGSANVSVGKRGMTDALCMTSAVEKGLGIKKGSALVCSTGVIGVPLPIEKIECAVPRLIKGLSPDGAESAVRAMMTTDAFPKGVSGRLKINGKTVTIVGLGKGAGMICPDMATMLAFFMTDANVPASLLRRALKDAIDASFNRITVDGDTSTNDTVLAMANSMSGARALKPGSRDYKNFLKLLSKLSIELAHMVVRDGEGATKFIEITIKGAASNKDAERVARTCALSMLVKTAFFGEDPNWGRIMAALGRSGARIREQSVDISINGVKLVRHGVDAGNEASAARAMRKTDIVLVINLGLGKGAYTLWTNDLTHEYVSINADYRS
jgi:glutamate N-acetyltransferase/amino-acid N-acetyltransferase